jgi:ATP/maltotriose-dependent transcriptional regulator MalT
VFKELGDAVGSAEAWTSLANLEWLPCRYVVAERALARALETPAALPPRVLEITVNMWLMSKLYGVARPNEVRRAVAEASAMLPSTRLTEMYVLEMLAVATVHDGDLRQARELAGRATSVAESIGAAFVLAQCVEVEGIVAVEAGDVLAGEVAFRRAYELLIAQGNEAQGSTSASELAWCLSHLGHDPEAEEFAVIGRELAADDDVASQGMARSALSLVESARGRHDEAVTLAREAVDLFDDAGAQTPIMQGQAATVLASVLRAASRHEEAVGAARDALAFYEAKGARPSADRARSFISACGG